VLSLALLSFGGSDFSSRLTHWGTAALIAAASLAYWWRVVTPAWVRTPAETYADRLLESVDTLQLGGATS
jgi:hypothetical protein